MTTVRINYLTIYLRQPHDYCQEQLPDYTNKHFLRQPYDYCQDQLPDYTDKHLTYQGLCLHRYVEDSLRTSSAATHIARR